MARHRWSPALLALAVTAASPLQAAQPEEPAMLPPTVVEGGQTPTVTAAPANPNLPPADGTGAEPSSLTTPSLAQAAEAIRLEAGGATLISPAELRGARLSNLEDLLRTTPGVWVTSQNGGDDVFLSIRGSGVGNRAFGRGVNSFIDGVIPAGRLDSGTPNQLMNLLANQYVEVFRGGNAMEFGATTLGGVINYVPYTGYTAPTVARFEFGPDAYFRTWAADGGVSGNTDYFASFDSFDYNGYREQGVVENYRLHVNLGYQFDGGETRFYFFGNSARQELPGTISKTQAYQNPSQAGPLNAIVDTDRNWLGMRAANKTTFQLDEYDTLTLAAYCSYDELDHLPTPFVGIIDNDYSEVGVTLRYEFERTVGNYDHDYLFGARYAYAENQANRYRYLDFGARPNKAQPVFDATNRARQVEVFFQDTMHVTENFRAIAGLQYFHTDRIFHDRALVALPPAIPPFPPQPNVTPGDQSFTRNYDQLSPRFGFTADVTDSLLLYGNVSRSAEAPAGNELEDRVAANVSPASLDAQTAWTTEIGLRGPVDGPIQFEATYYHSWVKDELLFVQGPLGPNTTVTFNAPHTRHEGFEFASTADLAENIFVGSYGENGEGDALQLVSVYNWFNFHFHNDPLFGDNRIAGIPEHTLYLSLMYQHPSGFSIGPNFRAVSGYGLTFDGQGGDPFRINGYGLFGLRANYQVTDRLFIYTDMINLGDRLFLADGNITPGPVGASAQVTPGINTAIYFGIEYRL